MEHLELGKQEKIIILVLVILSVVSWIVTVFHAHSMNSQMSTEMDMPMGMGNHSMIFEAPLFLVMWVVMMIAMMFPAVVPMVLIFSKVHDERKARNEGSIPTWVFVSGYLIVWAFFGVLAYFGGLLVDYSAMSFPKLKAYSTVIGGVVLIAAGLYQLTPLKNACLTHCRSPLHYYYVQMEGRIPGCTSDGCRPRGLLSWVLLGAYAGSLCCRGYESFMDGDSYTRDIR